MRTAINFGGGVQSTALAYLHIYRDKRLLEATGGNLPEVYIFADTGDEPESVYESVERTRKDMESAGIELVIVRKAKSLAADIEQRIESGKGGGSTPPFFIQTGNIQEGIVRRTCTADWKVAVIERYTKKRFGINPRLKAHRDAPSPLVQTWLGISTDEATRMRTSGTKWQQLYYPLVEMRWRRGDCIRYLEEIGVTAARSACVYCPFHSNEEWKRVQKVPEDWDRAVAFEKMLHKAHADGKKIVGLTSKPFLHRSLVPLDEIDFHAQMELALWGNECAGVCGV